MWGLLQSDSICVNVWSTHTQKQGLGQADSPRPAECRGTCWLQLGLQDLQLPARVFKSSGDSHRGHNIQVLNALYVSIGIASL